MPWDENRRVSCHLPDDYPQEDARGREACFWPMTLKDLKRLAAEPKLMNASPAAAKKGRPSLRCGPIWNTLRE